MTKQTITIESLHSLKDLFEKVNHGEKSVSEKLLRQSDFKLQLLEVSHDSPLTISRYSNRTICFFNANNENMFEYVGGTDELLVFTGKSEPDTIKLSA